MYMNDDDWKAGCAVVVGGIVLILLLIDVAFGSPDLITSRIMDKRYVPASSHVVYSTDSKGRTSSRVVIDPEEFILVVDVRSYGREYHTNCYWYNQFSHQEKVFVKINTGYLTGWVYVTDVQKWKSPEG